MRWFVTGSILLLSACSSADTMKSSERTEALTTMDVAEPPSPPAMVPNKADAPQPLKVAVPQMAYSYSYAFRLPPAAIAAVQQRHMALCDRLGASRCQLLAMESAGGDDDDGAAKLKLRVASAIAREFGSRLGASVTEAGGRTVSSKIAAEDVSKDIVDTEARLRQRELLVARLTEILRTRQGKVSELVEAERSVAAAQEEIDQAKGWLAELRARVAMSTVEIDYVAVAPGPAAARGGLGDSFTQSGALFVGGLSALAQLFVFLLPWALLGGAVWFVVARVRRVRRRDDAEPEEMPTAS